MAQIHKKTILEVLNASVKTPDYTLVAYEGRGNATFFKINNKPKYCVLFHFLYYLANKASRFIDLIKENPLQCRFTFSKSQFSHFQVTVQPV